MTPSWQSGHAVSESDPIKVHPRDGRWPVNYGSYVQGYYDTRARSNRGCNRRRIHRAARVDDRARALAWGAAVVPESDPDALTYDLVQRDAHVDVVLRGRPRLETVAALFAELERLTAADGELLILIDESEMDEGTLDSTELRAMMAAWEGSEGLRERSPIAIYAPTDPVTASTGWRRRTAGPQRTSGSRSSAPKTPPETGCSADTPARSRGA
jgi:hypothetical protein